MHSAESAPDGTPLPAELQTTEVEKDIDENTNFVVGPTGWTNVPPENRIFIDTDSGDGLVTSYDDETDWSLDGDGINDVSKWNRIAMTFDEEL